MSFKSEFENFYAHQFGIAELSPPVFDKFPMCVRFNIVDSSIKKKKKYIETAILRAQTVFNDLFNINDGIYLIVDSCEKFKDFYTGDCDAISPVRKCVSNQLDEYCYEKLLRTYDDTAEECPYSRYIIESSVNSLNTNALISQIINSELGGYYCLSDSVYIINKNSGVLYFLYNDAGLDVVSADKYLLESISIKFAKWVSASKL